MFVSEDTGKECTCHPKPDSETPDLRHNKGISATTSKNAKLSKTVSIVLEFSQCYKLPASYQSVDRVVQTNQPIETFRLEIQLTIPISLVIDQHQQHE